ncbi:MAG TPA: hypothetical protein VES89_09640 [Candidatus Competibacteraceae bacterium]|nr:hypothetical protein [Candidatus Competibacteraceae bacterium]
MSEYQYYEFQAIDRPLTEPEMRELRSYSSRATITPTRFVNHYQWGSFKGNPVVWMEKYFDAFLYMANWGTHELMLRLPQAVLDVATAQPYCAGESASVCLRGDHLILMFRSEDEGGEWLEEEMDRLTPLVPLRADIASGDRRALYLAWLACVQTGELDNADPEPACPPGLRQLTAPLEALVEFLRINRDLLEVAASGSPETGGTVSMPNVARWVSSWPDAEKTALLARFIEGNEPQLRAAIIRRFRESCATASNTAVKPRTVGELLQAAEQHTAERRRREAERAAREQTRRDSEARAAREQYLATLAQREAEAWREVDALIATKQSGKYDTAVQLLKDLYEIARRTGQQQAADARLAQLCQQHAKKLSLIGRLQAAGLMITTRESDS